MLPQKRSMHARWRASKRSMAASMAKRLAVRTHSTASCATPCIAAGTSGRWMFAIPVTRPATRAGWWVMQALQSSELPVAERLALLDVARRSIRHGLERGSALPVEHGALSPALQAVRASFVTLNQRGELRGCIGSLEARQPLGQDVAHNAWAAAFCDTRFLPLRE